MLDALRRMVAPITLSRGVKVAYRLAGSGRSRQNYYRHPVNSLMAYIGSRHLSVDGQSWQDVRDAYGRDALVKEGNIAVKDVTQDMVFNWFDSLRDVEPLTRSGKRLSEYTINSYARMVKAFFNKMVEAGHIDRSPAATLHLRKLPKKSKQAIAPGEIERMVKASKKNWRDHAVVLILRDSGCRVSELVSMRVSTTHMNEADGEMRGIARVWGKGDKFRWIFFGAKACNALRNYIDYRPHDAPDDLWLSIHGSAITANGIYQALGRVAERAGVETWNPHAFRHAFAKRNIERGMPVKVLQELLGHESYTTTVDEYVQFDTEELADYHAEYVRFGDDD